jgi:hypothetical protein
VKSKTKIVSIILFFLAFMMFVSCEQKQEKVGEIMEDGVEVIAGKENPFPLRWLIKRSCAGFTSSHRWG